MRFADKEFDLQIDSSSEGNRDELLGQWESACDPIIDVRRSLAIRTGSVIQAANTAGGWGNFQVVMEKMKPSSMTTDQFISSWLSSWSTAGGKTSGLTSGSFSLTSIMLRPDLEGNCTGGEFSCAGEGRLVYNILGSSSYVILEYKLPVNASNSKESWYRDMHKLSTIQDQAQYISELKRVVERFASQRFPEFTNSSAINQVRSNSLSHERSHERSHLRSQWGLRDFRLDSASGQLLITATTGSPEGSGQNSRVDDYVLNNEMQLRGLGDQDPEPFPDDLRGKFSVTAPWSFEKTVSASGRQAFNMTTCGGCHSPSVNLQANAGSGDRFLQAARGGLSSFLTGNTTGRVGPGGYAFRKGQVIAFEPFDLSGPDPIANTTYSDLHVRASLLIEKLTKDGGFCK